MRNKSVVVEAQEIQLAMEMIQLGARLQMLEAETNVSRERLLRLYKEVKGVSPPKGMLPFSTDWFLTWQPNIHASLFLAFHRFMSNNGKASGLDAILKAYRLYLEHVELHGMEKVLSLTRAWTLIRFIEAGMLGTTRCTHCGGHFVTHNLDLHDGYVCGLCKIPARAGKTRRAAELAELEE